MTSAHYQCHSDFHVEVEAEEKKSKLMEAKEKLNQLDGRIEVKYINVVLCCHVNHRTLVNQLMYWRRKRSN